MNKNDIKINFTYQLFIYIKQHILNRNSTFNYIRNAIKNYQCNTTLENLPVIKEQNK